MASVIKIKRSSVSGNAPTNAQLQDAELAINTADGKLYSANSTAVFEVGANLSSLTVNAQAFPSEDGGSGQILKTYGNGTLFWTNEAGAAGFSAFTLYEFIASTGQTNFAGNDVDGNSLGYRSGDSIQVFLNGILLEETEDYTATNGATRFIRGTTTSHDPIPSLSQESREMMLSTVSPVPAGWALIRDVRCWCAYLKPTSKRTTTRLLYRDWGD